MRKILELVSPPAIWEGRKVWVLYLDVPSLALREGHIKGDDPAWVGVCRMHEQCGIHGWYPKEKDSRNPLAKWK